MVKHCDSADDWEERKERIIGLGERSFHKSYYPQLKQNLDRLERFHTLLDHTSDFVVLVTLPDGLITDANAAFGRLIGKSVEALIGKSFESLRLGADAVKVLDILHRDMVFRRDPRQLPNHSVITKYDTNNTFIWLDLSFRIAVLDGDCYGVMVGRDVTERKRNEEMMTALLTEKAALLDNALVGIISVKDRRIISCNRRFEEMMGYTPGSAIGHSTRILYESDETFTSFGTEAYRALNLGLQFAATIMLVRANGEPFWCELTGRAFDSENPEKGSIWIFTDVNDRKLTEDRAVFLSHHDALTELPNHQLLKDRLEQAIMLADQGHNVIALMVIDIDRFKTINDSLGYGIGNQLLIDVAKRLKGCVREIDTVSRQGGDEFILLLPNLPNPDNCVTLVGELMAQISQPFFIMDKELALSVSVGIALYPDDGNDFESLMKKADMAMYRAKSAGRNTYRFFNEEMNDEATEQLNISVGLRKALENNQFQLYYQPQLKIRGGALIGAEALIRWNHPEFGMVSPARFIPVAEESGLIIPIGDWVMQEACREVVKWAQAGMKNPVVAVNLSALQFTHGDIEDSVARAIRDSGIAPEMLELELTESIMIRDTENVLATVKRLKSMGVRLSIDDFGTGYSSLSYLKRFAVDKLKIDQAFIRELVTNQDDAAIVRAIIQMACSLGLRTIAEGVETADVLDKLKLYRCDEVQGYYLGRPMPADDFMAYLLRHLGGLNFAD